MDLDRAAVVGVDEDLLEHGAAERQQQREGDDSGAASAGSHPLGGG